jgi:hypothetical protein
MFVLCNFLGSRFAYYWEKKLRISNYNWWHIFLFSILSVFASRVFFHAVLKCIYVYLCKCLSSGCVGPFCHYKVSLLSLTLFSLILNSVWSVLIMAVLGLSWLCCIAYLCQPFDVNYSVFKSNVDSL